MNLGKLRQLQPYLWSLPRQPGEERADVLLYGSAPLLVSMDDKVLEQIADVACLPGLVGAAMTMPDAHWDMDFRLAALLRLMQKREASFLPGALALISHAAYAACAVISM